MSKELYNINNRVDFEKVKLNRINSIQDEINTMNISLNHCIDIAYSSKVDAKTRSNYEQLKDIINSNNEKSNSDLDLMRDFTKLNLGKLIDKQEELLLEEKEKRQEKEQEDK